MELVHNEVDQRLLKIMEDFIPEKIFDAHSHLFSPEFLPAESTAHQKYGNSAAKDFFEESKLLYGDRELRAVFLPHPEPNLSDVAVRDRVNRWLIDQLQDAPGCAAGAYVLPTDTVEQLEEMVKDPRVRVFKPYYFTALGDKGGQSDISDFLPESAWQVADKHGLCITLHMMKTLSPADPVNKDYIKTMVARYPNAKLVLAHCGRGFATWQILQTAREYKEFPNIYYDIAAICESSAIFEVIRQSGADHVMWGTDYPMAVRPCIPFCFADRSYWLSRDHAGLEGKPIGLLGLESLFAFYQASLMLDLTKEEIQDIFYNNAVSIFGLE